MNPTDPIDPIDSMDSVDHATRTTRASCQKQSGTGRLLPKTEKFKGLIMGKLLHLFYLSAGGLGRQTCNFLALALAARKMRSSEFGLLSYWYAVAMIFAGISDWGMRFWGWRSVARHPGEWRVVTGIIGAKAISAAGLLLSYLVAGLLFSNGLRELFVALSFSGMIVFNQMTIDWAFRGLNKNFMVGLVGALSGVIFLLEVLIFGGSASLPTYGLMISLANFLGNIPAFAALHKLGWSPSSIDARQVFVALRKGLEYVPVSVMNRLYLNYPIVLLGIIGSRSETGTFRVAHMIYSLLVSSSYYLVGIFYTKMSRDAARGNSILPLLTLACVVGSALLVATALLVGPSIPHLVKVFFNRNYLVTECPFIELLWLAPLGFGHMILRESLPAFSQKPTGSYFIFLATVAGVCVSLATYSKFALLGIFYGMVAGEVTGTFCYAISAISENTRRRYAETFAEPDKIAPWRTSSSLGWKEKKGRFE